MEEKILNAQRQRWQETFSEMPEMFGAEPSDPARRAADLFEREGLKTVLELGCGQGRDTLYFAKRGLRVHALDYSEQGIEALAGKARETGFSTRIVTGIHDVRNPLPFADESFGACYSHMLFCMALTTGQLQSLSEEIRRVLQPGGICVYTVRHTEDAHYRKGVPRGEDMYETGGFIVHFFSREKVEILAKRYEIANIDPFEEGELPRKLFRVTLKKTS